MKQARVLTEGELKRVLTIVRAGRHAERNRLALLLSHYAGLRVGEIAALKLGDVVGPDGAVLDQLYLKPEQTKGRVSRTVFLNSKLRKEISQYVQGLSDLSPGHEPLIRSQKGKCFSANSLCQLLCNIYRNCGLVGATSHSGRRGFITKLAHHGVSAKVIMELAGHKNLGTTQRYIEVTDEMKRRAVSIFL